MKPLVDSVNLADSGWAVAVFVSEKKKHLDQDMFGCVDVDEQLSSLKQLCGSQSGYVSLFHRSVFLSTVGSASKNQGLSCQLMTLTYQI